MSARITQGGIDLYNYPVSGDQKRRDQERWAVPHSALPVRGQLWERLAEKTASI